MRGSPDIDHVRHDGLWQTGVGEGTMVRSVKPLVPTCESLTTLASNRSTEDNVTGQQ